MEKKRRNMNMLLPTIIMAILAIIFLAVGYSRGEGQHVQGLRSGFKMIVEILPLLLFAFIVAGMVQVLLPQELLSKWIGEESGLRGIFIGTLAGGITPGGPYVSLPLVAGLFKAGAGVGTLVAFLTAWSLWAVARLPMEIGILGWKFTFIRLACTFFFPPIAGFLAQFFFSGFK
ncbi:MAG: permease [Candidatus Aminicenantes bacterium]|nr:permease [Candidatus Aminicenantes bacterium]MDH5744068.1 permease [Candidatus Aminicenantes bacterium]